MKITYLPEVTSPTGSTVFPILTSGASKKVQLSTLNTFSGSGTVGNVFAGQNIKLSPSPAETTASVSFAFPGAIFPYPSDTLPAGWLFCNGQAVSRQGYPTLFSTIGVTYGFGDNRSTFNLPDLRGRTIVGLETMGGVSSSGRLTNSRPGNLNGSVLGATGGSDGHVLSSGEGAVPAHTHSITSSLWIYGAREDGDGRGSIFGDSDNTFDDSYYTRSINYSLTVGNSTSASATEAHSNLPPLVFLNWVIKY